MKRDFIKLTEQPKVIHSEEADEGALSLIKRLEKVDIGMDVLPNVYDQYTGTMEEKDYNGFCSFLYSRTGERILSLVEELEYEDEIFNDILDAGGI